MAKQILDADKIYGILDEFALEATGIKSLVSVMEDIVLSSTGKACGLDINDPMHPEQQMHALIRAVRRQMDFAERLVNTIIMGPAAS